MKKSIRILMILLLGLAAFACQHLESPSHGEPKEQKDIDVQLIHINKDTLNLVKEYSYCLKAGVYPDDAVDPEVLWSSLDENIAAVNDTGLVTGMGAGITRVILSSKSTPATDTCVVIVYDNIHVEAVNLDQTEATLLLGSKLKLTATVIPDNARIPDIEWSTDNEAVATVNRKGEVTPVAEGVANIKVTAVENGKFAVCKVTVERVKVTGITLDKNTLDVEPGGMGVIKATIIPENATIPGYSWSSSDESIATVDGGKVTGVAEGTATITATTEDGGFTAQCLVTVKKQSHGKEFTITFDLTSPTPSFDLSKLVADSGIEFTVPGVDSDGNTSDYGFTLFWASGGGAKPSWSANKYLVLNKGSYFGTPVIPGGTLKKLTFTQGANTNANRKSTMASETHTGAVNASYYDCAAEALGVDIVTGDKNTDYTYTIVNPQAEHSYNLLCTNSGIGLTKLVLTYEIEIKPIELTFNLTSPTPSFDLSKLVADSGIDFTVPGVDADGNTADYGFTLYWASGGGAKPSWSANKYLVLNKGSYFGTPVIPGFKLKSLVFTQGAGTNANRRSTMASETHAGAINASYYDCAAEALGVDIVTGNKDTDYTYTIVNPAGSHSYQLLCTNSGIGLTKLVLTYISE